MVAGAMPPSLERGRFVSVHDVMPGTLDAVDATLAHLAAHGYPQVTLLVVPGLDWTDAGLARLAHYRSGGHELAGHGWTHRAERIRGLRHRLHSAVISRDVAEHLALDEPAIEKLIRRCHDWFRSQELGSPSLYVPPAWALGTIRRDVLDALPFERYETLTGFYDVTSRSFRRVPLVGFEADTRVRVGPLRLWNRVNERLGERCGALRVALHPNDITLLLRDDLDALLTRLRQSAAA
jgi:predicted deacetylase